jgi:hypothetical protein
MDPATKTNDNNKAKFAAMLPLALLSATIKTLATGCFTKFIELCVLLCSLDATKSRLSQEDFVPHLACIKLKLNMSERLKEKAGVEYQALAAIQAKVSLAIFKNQAKNQIMRLINLEIKIIKSDIGIIFYHAIHNLICTLNTHHPTVDQANAIDHVSLMFEKHYNALLAFSEIDSVQAFFNLFKTANSIPTKAHEHETLSMD